MLEALGGDGSVYQNELALFNVEVALPPLEFKGDCFSKLAGGLRQHVARIRKAAERHGTNVVAMGILPTLGWDHLTLDYMTPKPRYAALNRKVMAMRGGEVRIYIRGNDTLQATHDNVMLEAFNTSFQLHLQVAPEEFARLYNAMQLATAPVLAAAGNSPLLLGSRLWEETRVALFRQSVDTRSDTHQARGSRPRVFFGDHWLKEGILEIVRDDISRFRPVLPMLDGLPDPHELLDRGEIPKLSTLALHNGTIYRWNRPCYGVAGGVPHLRIENRPLPAGPTAADGMANAAYLFGLTLAIADTYGDVSERMPFSECQANFYNAASTGLRAALHWVDGRARPADELILLTLPLAAEGLRKAGVDEKDTHRLLDIITERVASGQTGARWQLEGYNRLIGELPKDEALQSIVIDYVERQRSGRPVHTWSPAKLPGREQRRAAYQRVGQIMTTDLFTVQEQDTITLAEAMMRWERIRHVPVENEEGEFVGMFGLQELARALRERKDTDASALEVGQIMTRDVPILSPHTSTIEAIKMLQESDSGGLPVVRDGKLVGIVTTADFMKIAARLLQ